MAIVTVGQVEGLDIRQTAIGGFGVDGTFNLVDATRVEVSYTDGSLDVLTGSGFVLTNGVLTAGTITGFAETLQGAPVLSFSGVSFDVPTFMGWVQANDNTAYLNALLGGPDTVTGSSFADVLYLGADADSVTAGDGGDIVRGDAGNDTLNGGGGGDLLTGGTGDDSLDGGDGFDRVSYNDATSGVTVDLTQTTAQNTGLGLDTLANIEHITGSIYGDTLTGSGNANWLWGAGGADSISAGGGNDLVSVGNGAATLDGGADIDTLEFYSATLTGPVSVSLASQGGAQDTRQGVMTISGFENLVGTGLGGGDTLTGDANANTLAGWDGADSLVGGGGADTLLGDGTVFIDGGPAGTDPSGPITTYAIDGTGADTLEGGAGNDTIDGGNGTDTAVFSGARGDYQLALQGNGDVIVTDLRSGGPDGADTLRNVEALKFSDQTVITATAAHTFTGTSGRDTLTGTSSADTMVGAGDNDKLSGGDGADSLDGGAGRDTLEGEGGSDTLLGGDDDDVLRGGAGDDLLDGGAGRDRVEYVQDTGNFTIDLTKVGVAQNTGAGLDTLNSIEEVIGGWGNDTLTGDGADNWLSGYDGADSIDAGAGDDVVSLGYGNSTVKGGTGIDTLEIDLPSTAPAANISLALQGSAQTTGVGSLTISGFENLAGTYYGGDTLTGDGAANVLAGSGGSDSLKGGAGADTLLGDGVILTNAGAPHFLTTYGADANDTLEGGAGDDTLDGAGGTDTAVFSGGRADYSIVAQGNGDVIVTDLRSGGPDGADTLRNVESLRFSDTTVSIADASSGAGQTSTGTSGRDTFTGGAYADTITGVGGDDDLRGGGGGDSIDGGAGFDFVRGETGNDTLAGGDDDDFLNGGAGDDLIDGGAGTDRVVYGDAPGGVTVDLTKQGQAQNTGFGTDTLSNVEHVTGTGFNDVLTGDSNANWLWGQSGADTINAGGGNDLVTVGVGASSLDGGAGIDTLEFDVASTSGPVNASLLLQGAAQNTLLGSMTISGFENLVGSKFGGDTLTGDTGANTLAGWGGNDSLNGGDGDDRLLGDGVVYIDGGPSGTYGSGPITTYNEATDVSGNDSLNGGAGADTIIAGAGDDALDGGAGDDSLDGGAGNDVALYVSATGAVTVDLANGTASGAAGSDTLTNVENVTASAFNDLVTGSAVANIVFAGAGADTVRAGDGDDQLNGQAGSDQLFGEAGNDTITAGADDDFLSGGVGDDVLDGGTGVDRAAFSSGATTGVTVSLASQGVAQNTGQGMDTLIGIENLSGTIYNDTLTGDNSANWIWGGSNGSGTTGDDSINAAGGDDLVQVGAGANSLDGGAGFDVLSFHGNSTDISAGVNVALGVSTAQTTNQGSMTLVNFEGLSGSTFGDTLSGDSSANTLAGYGGSDSLVGGGGADILLGDGLVHISGGSSSAIGTFLDEGSGADTLDGGQGADSLVGGAGDDRLLTGTGNDTVDAGAGADRVIAQAGAGETSRITLGAGVDTLQLDAAFGGQVVATDFAAGTGGDVLDIAAYLTAHLTGWNGTDNPFQVGFLQLVQNGAATLLQIDANGGGDSFTTLMTLENTSSLKLLAGNLGYAPLPLVKGGASGDQFAWVEGSPANTVDGGGGTDTVSIVAPAASASTSMHASADGSALEFDFNGDGTADLTITNVEDIVLNGERVVISGNLSGTGLAPNTITYMGTAGDNLLDASGLLSVESIHAEGNDGADTLIGAADDDYLSGGNGADSLSGAGGPDVFDGGTGNDTMSGGAGTDHAVFTGDHTAYTVTDNGGGSLTVTGPDGTDQLTDIELLQFDDGTFGENHAPSGADVALSVTTGGSRVLTGGSFGFSDPDGDDIGAVKIVALPASGALTNNGVAVTAGQTISAVDLAAGHLVFTPAGQGTVTFTFQVLDEGFATWGTNLDATPNTLTLNTSDAPAPTPSGPTVITTGTTGTAGADVVTLSGSQGHAFFAGDGADSVTSGAGADTLQGNAGADVISAGAGDDVVYGGRDNDQLNGDDGADWISGDAGDDSLSGGVGKDAIFGGDGDDVVNGGDGEGYLRGGDGADSITGGGDFDNTQGNTGNDVIHGGGGGDWVVGGKDQDALYGDDGDDIVYGNMGEDTCVGGAGADLVRGGQGDDVVDGGAGADWLSGDLGSDTITGGAGADIFHSFAEAGVDRVLDFSILDGDRVQLDKGTLYTTAQVGADTVLTMTGGAQLILVGVQMSSLSSGWIFEV